MKATAAFVIPKPPKATEQQRQQLRQRQMQLKPQQRMRLPEVVAVLAQQKEQQEQQQRLTTVATAGIPISSAVTPSGGFVDTDDLVCDGKLNRLSLPRGPFPTLYPFNEPFVTPKTISCSRGSKGSTCAAQGSVQCGAFVFDVVTFGGEGRLGLPPSNPLVFNVAAGSKYLTYVKWTVADVGTAGAKLVGKYGTWANSTQVQRATASAHDPDVAKHAWETNKANFGFSTAARVCGSCGNCEKGTGIADLALTARPGSGYKSIELSQLYENALCGDQCNSQDAIFFSGMEYQCAEVGNGPGCSIAFMIPARQQGACCSYEHRS
jgi:hypothetical protein